MRIILESDAGVFETQHMEVTQDQFNELVDASAISGTGYWLLDDYAWNLLAIGLDQVPGGFDLEVELEGVIH